MLTVYVLSAGLGVGWDPRVPCVRHCLHNLT